MTEIPIERKLVGFEQAMSMLAELEDANADYTRVLASDGVDKDDTKQVRYQKAFRAIVDQLALSPEVNLVDYED